MLLGIEVRPRGTRKRGTTIEGCEDLERASKMMLAYLDLGLEARIVALPQKRREKKVDISGWGWKCE